MRGCSRCWCQTTRRRALRRFKETQQVSAERQTPANQKSHWEENKPLQTAKHPPHVLTILTPLLLDLTFFLFFFFLPQAVHECWFILHPQATQLKKKKKKENTHVNTSGTWCSLLSASHKIRLIYHIQFAASHTCSKTPCISCTVYHHDRIYY